MESTQTTAVVVGGSLSGLMTAILLKSHSYNVHVLERSDAAALQSQAAGIRAGPQVHAFIAKYIRNYPTYFTTTDKAEIVDKKGDVVTVIPAKDPLRLTTWRRLYEMFKRELLTDDEDNGKADARYETGKRVEGVIDVGDKMMVTYCDLKSDTVHSVHVDFVIAADGANSKVRSILPPGSAPQYVGYVTWRGRVPENIVSTETRDALKGRCVLMRVERGYLVSYYVPSDTKPAGHSEQEHDFVWIWYDIIPKESMRLGIIMTDIHDVRHTTTIPRGKMQPGVHKTLLESSSKIENSHFVELISKTNEPFVCAIHERAASDPVLCGGKVLLVGDALALCRPHRGDSTNEAAFQVLKLGEVLERGLSLDQWRKVVVESAENARAASCKMAEALFGGAWEKVEQEVQRKQQCRNT